MFGIDGIEFLIIILVAVIVIGPKDMPKMLRAFAQAVARIRALAQEFRSHFDEAMRQADMQESVDSLKNIGDTVRELDPRRKLQEFYASLERETALEKEQRLEAEKFAKEQNIAGELSDGTQPLMKAAAAKIKQAEPVGDFAASDAISGCGEITENLDKAAACAVEGRPYSLTRTENALAAAYFIMDGAERESEIL